RRGVLIAPSAAPAPWQRIPYDFGHTRAAAFVLCVCAAARPRAAQVSRRREGRADFHDQYRILGAVPAGPEGAAFCRRTGDDTACAARRRARYRELDLARIRPARRHLAADG